MDLNELLYIGGEVNKFFRMPQGPDSGFLLYDLQGQASLLFLIPAPPRTPTWTLRILSSRISRASI